MGFFYFANFILAALYGLSINRNIRPPHYPEFLEYFRFSFPSRSLYSTTGSTGTHLCKCWCCNSVLLGCWCHNTEQHSNTQGSFLVTCVNPSSTHREELLMWKTTQPLPCQRSVMFSDVVLFHFFWEVAGVEDGLRRGDLARACYHYSTVIQYECRKSYHRNWMSLLLRLKCTT